MLYAAFWQRVSAGLVDFLLLLPLLLCMAPLETASPAVALLAYAVTYGAPYVYAVTLHATRGQTVGKRALGIRVVRLDGSPIGWRGALLRSVIDLGALLALLTGTALALVRVTFDAYRVHPWSERGALLEAEVPWLAVASQVYAVYVLVELVVIVSNRRRRALHDFVAGTVVVAVERGEPASSLESSAAVRSART